MKSIETSKYLYNAEQEVKNFISDRYSLTFEEIEVIQVWYCKTIQNHKGLFIARNLHNNLLLPYFIEITYNGEIGDMYLDFYLKEHKHTINIQ